MTKDPVSAWARACRGSASVIARVAAIIQRLRTVLLLMPALTSAPLKLPAQAAPAQSRDSTFRITPVRPMEDLRRQALRQSPPREADSLLAPDLVELVTVDSSIRLDIRYATSNNFMGGPMYS